MLKREAGLDIFRVMCCVGVIAYHVLDDRIVYAGTSVRAEVLLYFLASFCVPGFFLLSGFLLGRKSNISLSYFMHKIFVTAAKYGGWVILWCIFYCVILKQCMNPFQVYIDGLLGNGGIMAVAWFYLPYMVALALAYPVLLLRKKTPKLFAAVCITQLVALALPFDFSGLLENRTQFFWFPFYFTYFIAGIWLNDILKKIKTHETCKAFFPAIAGAVCAFSLFEYISAVFCAARFRMPQEYYGRWYYSLWLISLFLLVSLIRGRESRAGMLLTVLSKGTFSVYMLHLPILQIASKAVPIHHLATAIGYFVGLFIGCEAIAFLFSRVPILRKISFA